LKTKVAERWLRAELSEQRANKEIRERASGEGAYAGELTEGSTPFLNAGGFAPGRMLTHYA